MTISVTDTGFIIAGPENPISAIVINDLDGNIYTLNMSLVNSRGMDAIFAGTSYTGEIMGFWNNTDAFIDPAAEQLFMTSITSRFDGVQIYQAFDANGQDKIYQNSDNIFVTQVTDQVSGETIDPNDFSNAEYILAKRKNVLVKKTLDDGISIANSMFITKIDDGEITAREGDNYTHQFVVFDADGNKRPPIFIRPVSIVKVVKAED
jgi:hypothetical protein